MLYFLLRFAWQDLTDRYARRTTLVVFFTTAGVCAVTLGVYGFFRGVERVKLRRLGRDPLALCLWTGSDWRANLITPEVRQELERAVAAQVGDGLKGVYPFRQAEFDWVDSRDKLLRLRGRTIQPGAGGDPLMDSLPLRAGGHPFTGPDDKGVILSPAMLRALGLPKDETPGELRLHTNGGAIYPVRVVGVTEKDLPLGHLYVLPELYDHFLRHQDANPRWKYLTTGRLPANWPADYANVPKDVKDELELWQLKAPPDRVIRGENRWAWALTSKNAVEEAPTLADWLDILKVIKEAMPKAADADEFEMYEDAGQRQALGPPPTTYDLTGIYLNDLQYLNKAADACETVKAGGEPLEVNRDVVNQVVSVGEDIQVYLGVLQVVEWVVVGVALLNILVLQALRAEQKVGEVGMLKAMGMTGRTLAALTLLEGALVGAPAALAGWAVGMWGGSLAAARCYAGDLEEARLGFFVPTYLQMLVPLAAVAACLACALLTDWPARRAAPSQSLRSA